MDVDEYPVESLVKDPKMLKMLRTITTINGYKKMLEFSSERYQEENVLYFKAVREFKLCTDKIQKFYISKRIYADFIGNGCSHQVNISGLVKDKLEDDIYR